MAYRDQINQLLQEDRFEEAIQLTARLVNDMEERRGVDDSRTNRYRRVLAHLLWHVGRADEARQIYEATAESFLRITLPDSPKVRSFMENAVELYRSADSRHLQSLLAEAVARQEERVGDGHPRIAAALVTWARFCWRVGDYQKAFSLCVRAGKIHDKEIRELKKFLRTIRRRRRHER